MFASVALLAGLSGCSGLFALFSPVPAAGIAYLKSLPKGAFQAAKPANVRVAINLPAGIVIKNPVMRVSAEKQTPGAREPSRLQARIVLHKVARNEAFPATLSGGSGQWTYYALTRPSRSEFHKLQTFLPRMRPKGADENGPKVTLTIKFHNQTRLANCDRQGSVPLSAAILLDPKRGYVTVWDHSVPLSKLAARKDRICPSNRGRTRAEGGAHSPGKGS